MPFYYDRKTMRNFMRRRAGNKGLPMRVVTLTPEDFECPNPAVEGEVIE